MTEEWDPIHARQRKTKRTWRSAVVARDGLQDRGSVEAAGCWPVLRRDETRRRRGMAVRQTEQIRSDQIGTGLRADDRAPAKGPAGVGRDLACCQIALRSTWCWRAAEGLRGMTNARDNTECRVGSELAFYC